MKKIYLLGLAMFAVLAYGAVMAASSALALESVWLVDGAKPLVGVAADVEGLLELTDTNVPGIGEVKVHCEGSFDGLIGPGKEDLIEEVLTPGGVKVEELVGAGLICKKVTSNCEEPAMKDIELWPENLPWLTEIELMTTLPKWLDIFRSGVISGANPAYELLCLILGINAEDLCSGLTSLALEENTAENDVIGLFDFNAPISSEKGTCTEGGANSGELLGEGLILVPGKVLTFSEG
jgi:hypothetical protein